MLVFIVVMLLFVTCGPAKHTWKNIGTDGFMVEIFNGKIEYSDFLKRCELDTLSTDLSEWLEMGFYNSDYKLTKQWVYIKDTDTNRVYVLTFSPDSTYFLDIRDIIIEDKTK